MKFLSRYVVLVMVLALVAFGCSEEPELLQAPSTATGPMMSALDGSENLGPATIPIADGTGFAVGGVGLRAEGAGQPGTITVDVPAGATVEQVIVYWEGHNPTATGDAQITVGGNSVTGTLIGGPTRFFNEAYSSTYRADVTSLGLVSAGISNVSIDGMEFAKNNGAGMLVVYDDGSGATELFVNDGNDLAYWGFASPLNTTEAQTFTFLPATVARNAQLPLFASSVQAERPNVVEVTVGGVTTTFVDPFGSVDGRDFDSVMEIISIPAGATELTVQALSAADASSPIAANDPASLAWICAGLSVPIQLASIGDFVWHDLNQDGIQDTGEPGIEGVTVNLYKCGENTAIKTMLTDAAGGYLFDNLMPGDYFVEFILPSGYVFSPQDQGADDAKDSDANPTTGRTICTTLDPGENDMTWDGGMYLPLAAIGDFVWYDEDEDGIQDFGELGIEGVTVQLFVCGQTTPAASMVTGASGYYLFQDLQPGDYFVKFIPLADYVFSPQDQGADDALDSDADPSTGMTVCTTLDPGETDLTWDAGMFIPLAAIGDYVWYDDNEDGIQDAGEMGIQGAHVYLYSCDPVALLASTTTDVSGYYLFDNLVPGDYYISFALVPGLEFSPQNQGSDDTVDSDADPVSGIAACTTLDPGEVDLTWDAGMYEPTQVYGCRMTGGANNQSDEVHPDRGTGTNVYTCGGQAGAKTALQPQPWGEWTHTQKRGPAGSFTFHAGTASAPPGTEIDWIECTDEGWCKQARPAPAKQLDFAGVGTFKNIKNPPPSIGDYVVVGESMHWFEVNIDDLGEPGKAGKVDPPAEFCDVLGVGRNGDTELADCECPDFYRIKIYEGPDDSYPVMYEAFGYIDGGNFQLHPLTGHDRRHFESKGGGHNK